MRSSLGNLETTKPARMDGMKWERNEKKDGIPHVRPADWLDVAFFLWHLQLDGVKVRASLPALRPDADPQWQHERPGGEARRSRSREEVSALHHLQTHLTSPLNNSAPHLWRASGKAAPVRRADNTPEEERGRRKHVLLRVERCHLSHHPSSFRAKKRKKKRQLWSLTNRPDTPPAGHFWYQRGGPKHDLYPFTGNSDLLCYPGKVKKKYCWCN